MIKQVHLIQCDSTQDILKEQLSASPGAKILVSCESQTNGRGRGLNLWKDSPGTLCFSLNVNPSLHPSFTALELSVLVCRFFETKGRETKLKWPNDILTPAGLKCGGILVQSTPPHIMAGIGINLFFEGHDFGGVYEAPFEISKEKWAMELAMYIQKNRYTQHSYLKADWLRRCSHQNLKVKISDNNDVAIGVFTALGDYGEAILKTDQGEHKVFNGNLRII